jgi:hypothetical protein
MTRHRRCLRMSVKVRSPTQCLRSRLAPPDTKQCTRIPARGIALAPGCVHSCAAATVSGGCTWLSCTICGPGVGAHSALREQSCASTASSRCTVRAEGEHLACPSPFFHSSGCRKRYLAHLLYVDSNHSTTIKCELRSVGPDTTLSESSGLDSYPVSPSNLGLAFGPVRIDPAEGATLTVDELDSPSLVDPNLRSYSPERHAAQRQGTLTILVPVDIQPEDNPGSTDAGPTESSKGLGYSEYAHRPLNH